MGQFVNALLSNGTLREGATSTIATETVWATASPEVYHLLCIDRKWTIEQYQQWLSNTLERFLLP
jgi:TetR/AcrR family transcriptional regulator, regulator of autoinduction and epiphytic fitness